MPDAKLLILGQGGNKDYLERLIKDYKLEDSIKLLGYKSKDELTNAEKMLADAIIEMLQNEEQRNDYKQRIMKRAADFDPDKITQEWLDIL